MHFIIRCQYCNRVISQCRCPDPNKSLTYGVCDTCKDIRKVTGGFLIPESAALAFPGGKKALEEFLTKGDESLIVEYYAG
jgi:hypothetical protein